MSKPSFATGLCTVAGSARGFAAPGVDGFRPSTTSARPPEKLRLVRVRRVRDFDGVRNSRLRFGFSWCHARRSASLSQFSDFTLASALSTQDRTHARNRNTLTLFKATGVVLIVDWRQRWMELPWIIHAFMRT